MPGGGGNGTNMIGDYTEERLLKRAAEVVQSKSKDNTLFDTTAENRLPRFSGSELNIGRVLGRGGFCVVSEITKVTLLADAAPNDRRADGQEDDANVASQDQSNFRSGDIVQDRHFMSKHYLRGGKEYRYAIKQLDDSTMTDPSVFVNGVVDLAIEARFLAVIRHPNIIKMRAVAVGSPFTRDYFVVLDRLYDILSTRLNTWKKRRVKGLGKLFDRKGKKKIAFWLERVTVGHDLGCALKYLHSVNVMYRDLKPDNIGFDVRGDVKIFDFGLAKEFDTAKMNKNGLYKLTGDTGSPRYMAPEVALDQPYNETVDVYSFGILLWQMLALETPFELYTTMQQFKSRVVMAGVRPKVDPKWPSNITDMIRSCWSTNISERPSMEEVTQVLRDEISVHTDEEVLEMLDVSRKSAAGLSR